MSALDEWEAEAKLMEPHHEYKEAEPSPSGKTGVRCIFCGHYTNGMERGNCSPCPNHARYRIKTLINLVRKKDKALEYYADHCPPFVSIDSGYAPAAGKAKEALALTEDLK